jgi:hypothetical protein
LGDYEGGSRRESGRKRIEGRPFIRPRRIETQDERIEEEREGEREREREREKEEGTPQEHRWMIPSEARREPRRPRRRRFVIPDLIIAQSSPTRVYRVS